MKLFNEMKDYSKHELLAAGQSAANAIFLKEELIESVRRDALSEGLITNNEFMKAFTKWEWEEKLEISALEDYIDLIKQFLIMRGVDNVNFK